MSADNSKSADDTTSDAAVLAANVRGPVFLPGDDGYDVERDSFQAAFHHRPAVVVGAECADDVRAAMAFADERGLAVAVQATGHGLSATLSDEGILINTTRMDDIQVDAASGTAWIEAGVRFEQLVPEAARHGLAPLNGSAPHVGAVGYTLGGGLGLLSRSFGYAADHVRRLDLVTGDGRLHHVTADSEPDLFWALRGGSGNFGVVTGIEIELLPVSRIYGGSLYFDGELAEKVLRAWLDWTVDLPEGLTSSVSLLPFPDVPVVPEPLRGRYVAQVRIAFTGDAETGAELVDPLRAVGPRLMDDLREMPYTESWSICNDPTTPHGYHSDNALLRDFDADVVPTLLTLAGPTADAMCILEFRHLGGALARQPAVANAVGGRDAHYMVSVLSPLFELSDVEKVQSVHEQVLEAVKPWMSGRCLNFLLGGYKTAEQVATTYNSDDYHRLAELKSRHDPKNVFHRNHNVVPADQG